MRKMTSDRFVRVVERGGLWEVVGQFAVAGNFRSVIDCCITFTVRTSGSDEWLVPAAQVHQIGEAAARGDAAALTKHLKIGAVAGFCVDTAAARSGDTALMVATKAGDLTAMRLLLDHASADPDVGNATTRKVPLDVAIRSGHAAAVALLVDEFGCSMDGVARDGSAPLHVAAELMDAHAVALAPAATRTEAVDGRGRLALHAAAGAGSIPLAQELLDAGADPQAVDDAGCTPLLHAAGSTAYTATGVVSWLALHGADVRVRDDKHRSPVHLAARAGNAALVWRLFRDPHNLPADDEDAVSSFRLSAASIAE